ncbi:hypothetical protein NL676_034513 [Syzygium grande]|nr:hypothetical protein NL676_034513 [Syzygium grande]
MERTARTAGRDRTATSPVIRRQSTRPRCSAGRARGFRAGQPEEIGMAERLTDVFVGGGDGDLLMQRSDREDRVLQALDMQVVGACRADERLKPLLKSSGSSSAAKDRLLAHLSRGQKQSGLFHVSE